MKKLFIPLFAALLIHCSVYAQTVYDDDYVENPNYVQGNKYLQNSQYSSAITEFKKALRTDPKDASALIGLSNAYNLRAAYYNNTQKDTAKAISDLKSALFFIKYFADENYGVSSQSVNSMESNLKTLESSTGNSAPDKIYSNAKSYRIKGEFAAAGYDFYRLLNNNKYKEEANTALGDIFKIFNRPEKSLIFYQNAVAVNSSNSDTKLKLAKVYEETGNFNESLKEYNEALQSSRESYDILSSLERVWQKKVDENPKDAEAHANLGVVYQKQKRYDEALSEYKKAEALNPSNNITRINIGTLYQDRKNYDMAINTYNNILQSDPKNTDVMCYKAECLKETGKTDEAVSLYKTVLNIDPNKKEVKAKLFELIKDTMSEDKVLEYMYQNLQSEPMTAQNCYEFAYELHKAGKIDDAATYYNQALKLDKNLTDAYINLSQIYRQKKDYKLAFDTIKIAKDIDPNNELVKKQFEITEKEVSYNFLNDAANAYESGDYQKAVDLYSKITPQTSDSLLGLAASYQALKNNSKAIETYKKAIELNPKNADLPYYIAALYADENNFNDALTYINSSLTKNPSSSKAQELKKYITAKSNEGLLSDAVKLFEANKYNESIIMFGKVLAADSDNASVYYYRAMAYDALKNYKKAIDDYKSVLKYAPDMIIAYYMLGVDYDALNQFSNAKDNYMKYVKLSTEDDDYKKYAQSRIDEIK